jgi:3-oxoacyl-[acyl-carrier protein] reductase
MKRQGGGVILNTGSTAGIRPRIGASSYAASKGAVIALTKALAIELAPFRIRVVSINPVAVDTPMLSGIHQGRDPNELLDTYLASIPMGRLNQADDIARAALYLASDEAFMVTGTAFEIDGGRDI